MTGDIETYLQSADAVRDVGIALSQPHPLWRVGGLGAWADIVHVPAHGRYDFIDRALVRQVYYRPQGERFIVTDLGEAVHALRLRTGALCIPEECGPLVDTLEAEFQRVMITNTMLAVGVAVADLPRAICGVMLAAWRVECLEPEHE